MADHGLVLNAGPSSLQFCVFAKPARGELTIALDTGRQPGLTRPASVTRED